MTQKEKIVITGGGGFLGTEVVQAFLAKNYEVIAIGRNVYPHIKALGAQSIACDINDLEKLNTVCQNAQGLIHTAAKAGFWGPPSEYFKINVEGTKNVIQACIKNNIPRLIYTSSPSVVIDQRDIKGEDESLPYLNDYLATYPLSKKIAEQAILASNGSQLKTLALRPHLIFGENDPHMLHRLAERGQSRNFRKIGPQNNKIDVIYVKNAALAHLQAYEALKSNPELGGESFFLGQEEPVNLWNFVDQLLKANGLNPMPQKTISKKWAYRIATIMESIYRNLRIYHKEPPITRFLVQMLSSSHYFNHKKAQDFLGYKPEFTLAQSIQRIATNSGQACP